MKTITVAELREKLAKLDGNLEVFSDGCDCEGEAVGINVFEGYVLLCRQDGYREDKDPTRETKTP